MTQESQVTQFSTSTKRIIKFTSKFFLVKWLEDLQKLKFDFIL